MTVFSQTRISELNESLEQFIALGATCGVSGGII